MKKNTIILLTFIVIFTVLGACSNKKATSPKKILIYCGITMIKPMTEIASNFEKQHNCKVIIIKGGSGNLLKSIETNKVGDLYLPGSEAYIAKAKKQNLITATAHVGYNKAAMIVIKGNPLNIPADLSILTNSSLYVVLGNPRSGSIGLETKKILTRFGNYDQAIKNSRQLTTDSKKLVQVIRDKEADVVINWFATSTWEGNNQFMDVIPIDEKYAPKKKLILAVLTYSKHPKLAEEFLEYAASEKGNKIFNKYGLYEIR